jgi:hypothetical protein
MTRMVAHWGAKRRGGGYAEAEERSFPQDRPGRKRRVDCDLRPSKCAGRSELAQASAQDDNPCGGEEKACPPAFWRVNRNSCQFKNSRISLRNSTITFFYPQQNRCFWILRSSRLPLFCGATCILHS